MKGPAFMNFRSPKFGPEPLPGRGGRGGPGEGGGDAHGRVRAGRGRGAPAPPAEDRLGAPNARLPQGAAAALEGLDSRKLARLTGPQLVTVVLHLLRIAVKHRRERALRHGEALEALEARRRQARARRQRAVQRQLASREGGGHGWAGPPYRALASRRAPAGPGAGEGRPGEGATSPGGVSPADCLQRLLHAGPVSGGGHPFGKPAGCILLMLHPGGRGGSGGHSRQ